MSIYLVHPDDLAAYEFEFLSHSQKVQHNRYAAGLLDCGCKAYDIEMGCDHDCMPDYGYCEFCGEYYELPVVCCDLHDAHVYAWGKAMEALSEAFCPARPYDDIPF